MRAFSITAALMGLMFYILASCSPSVGFKEKTDEESADAVPAASPSSGDDSVAGKQVEVEVGPGGAGDDDSGSGDPPPAGSGPGAATAGFVYVDGEPVCSMLDFDPYKGCVDGVYAKIAAGEIEKARALAELAACLVVGGEMAEICTVKIFDEIKSCTDTIDQQVKTGAIEKSAARDALAVCIGAVTPGDDDDDDAAPGDDDDDAAPGDDDDDAAPGDDDDDAAPGDDDDDGDDDDMSDKDIWACSKALGIHARHIKVAGSKRHLQLSTGEVLAIKVTGNYSVVDLKLVATATASKLGGLCIFAAGNKPVINVDISVDIGKLVYIGRGNQGQCSVNTQTGHKLDELSGDLSGNGHRLRLFGKGTFPCEKVRRKGHKTIFECEKD